MTFSLFDLVSHAAKTRPLQAGTLIGSGTVSNQDRATGYVRGEIRGALTVKRPL